MTDMTDEMEATSRGNDINRTDGRTYRQTPAGPELIANYGVVVHANIVESTGMTVNHTVELLVTCNGETHTANVPVAALDSGRYIDEILGAQAVGGPARDARAAIARDVRAQAVVAPVRRVYTRLGWHGQTYVHAGGVIGGLQAGDVTVDISLELRDWKLPSAPGIDPARATVAVIAVTLNDAPNALVPIILLAPLTRPAAPADAAPAHRRRLA